MTDLDDQLRDLYGPLARHSEYKCGDQVRYWIGAERYSGPILWVMEPGPSMIEGRGPQPLRYVVERANWEAIPDVIWSSDIDT